MRQSKFVSLIAAGTLAVAALALPSLVGAQAVSTVGQAGGSAAPAGRGGRGPAGPPPTVLNLGSYGHSVQDLDAAVAFYRDGMGLDLVLAPRAPAIDEERNRVMNTPDAKTRVARFAIPNEPYAIELVEYSGIDRKPMMSHHNDPGSSFLNFGYVDMGDEYKALSKFNPRMVGTGPLPTGLGPGMNVAWIRDPDGIMIEVMNGGWDGALKSFPSVRNVYRSHFGVTLENYMQGMTFYHDLLGFDITAGFGGSGAGEFKAAGEGMSKMLGVPAEAKFTGIAGHCANAHCEMFEFKDAPRTAFRPRSQDPGAAYLSVWVSDLDALLAKMKAANIEIVTPGGTPIAVSTAARGDIVIGAGATAGPARVHTSRQILVRDPGGFLVLLMQRTS